jgi:HEAT repeat protein
MSLDDFFEKSQEELVSALLDDDFVRRTRAAEVLSTHRDPRIVEPLIAALRDPHPMVRTCVVRALGEIRDPRALDPLLQTLSDSQPEVRRWAAFALGGFKSMAAVPGLIRILDDENPAVRSFAIRSLGELKATQAIEVLKSCVLGIGPRHDAIQALRKIGNDSIPVLMELAKHPERDIRFLAIDALHQLRTPRAIEASREAARDESVVVRLKADEALASLSRAGR